jgi:hypothetical protein
MFYNLLYKERSSLFHFNHKSPIVRRLLAEICDPLWEISLSLVLLLWFVFYIGVSCDSISLVELFSCICGLILLKRRFTL